MPGSANVAYVMRSIRLLSAARVAHREHGDRDGGQEGDCRREARRVARAQQRQPQRLEALRRRRDSASEPVQQDGGWQNHGRERRRRAEAQRGHCPTSKAIVSGLLGRAREAVVARATATRALDQQDDRREPDQHEAEHRRHRAVQRTLVLEVDRPGEGVVLEQRDDAEIAQRVQRDQQAARPRSKAAAAGRSPGQTSSTDSRPGCERRARRPDPDAAWRL